MTTKTPSKRHEQLDNAVIEEWEKELAIDPKLLNSPISKTEKEIIQWLEEWARRSESKAVTIQANIGLLEDIKAISKALKVPYSRIINKLMELLVKGKIKLDI